MALAPLIFMFSLSRTHPQFKNKRILVSRLIDIVYLEFTLGILSMEMLNLNPSVGICLVLGMIHRSISVCLLEVW